MRDTWDRSNPWNTRDIKEQANATRVRSCADIANVTGASPARPPGFHGGWSADAVTGPLEQAEGACGTDFGEGA